MVSKFLSTFLKLRCTKLFGKEIFEIAIRSLIISSSATLMSSIWSIPISIKMSNSHSRIVNILISIFNAMIGLPTVLVGLFLYMVFSRSGPLGFLELLYRPEAIVIGEAILITPLIISLLYETFHKARLDYWEVAFTLGADERQAYVIMIREVFSDIIIVLLIAFSRALGELGVALMVGGNIRGYTRVFTTAIALEVAKGNFEIALNLGALLLAIISIIAVVVRFLGVKKS